MAACCYTYVPGIEGDVCMSSSCIYAELKLQIAMVNKDARSNYAKHFQTGIIHRSSCTILSLGNKLYCLLTTSSHSLYT